MWCKCHDPCSSCEVTASMLSAVDVVITIVSTELVFNLNVRQWGVLVSLCMAVDRHDGADMKGVDDLQIFRLRFISLTINVRLKNAI